MTNGGLVKTLVSLSGVTKRYGTVLALDRFDLEIQRGEFLALLGPNGAGKTTAISLMLGLQRPDDGEVRLFGDSPQRLEPRRRLGVMMQDAALVPELRVRELIDLTASYYPAPMTANAAMELTQTVPLANRPYGQLSGGQKRQAQFAIAIVGRPSLLFLDEPTAGLDVQARELMWASLRRLVAEGCAVLLTTHYLEEAEALASRVAVLAKGRLIAAGTVRDMSALVARKQVACVTQVSAAEIQTWSGVQNVRREHDRFHITTTDAESLVRRLMATDSTLRELEVRRAGLAQAVTELMENAE
jgi:ABC-2 type transport system ATP-binding protein